MKKIMIFQIIMLIILSFFISCASATKMGAVDSMPPPAPEAPMMTDEMAFKEAEEMKMDEMPRLEDSGEMMSVEEETIATGAATADKPDASKETGIETARQLATRGDFRNKTPELLARVNGTDMEPLPFVSHDIYVVITGHRARVVYDMVFQNPVESELSGSIMIELPDGASPSYLGMFLGTGTGEEAIPAKIFNPAPPSAVELLKPSPVFGGTWQGQEGTLEWGELRSARVVNPVKGRQVYEQITRRQVDPALSEWAGGNKFSTKIYPIPGKSYKRVLFAYDRPLATEKERLFFSLPLPETPPAETRMQIYTMGKKYRNSAVLAGEAEVPSRDIDGGRKWRFIPEEGFEQSLVFFGEPENPDLQVIAGSDSEIPGKLVHMRYTPELQDSMAIGETGKALFLLDTSYSSREKLYSQSGKMLRALLEEDLTIKEFAVVAFDVIPRPLNSGFVENNKQNREETLAAVESLWLEGATNFSSVLELIDESPVYSYADSLFLLSDGHITWGNDNTREFQTRFSSVLEKQWYCYAFGDISTNKELFNALVRGGGQNIRVGPGQDLQAAALFHRKPSYRLDYINVDNGIDIMTTGSPRFISPGQVLEIGARVFEGEDAINFSISINGSLKKVDALLVSTPAINHIAARSWAQVYVNELLSLYDRDADEAVLALSQRFALTNREASFIILETDEEYVEHKIEKKMLDPDKIMEIVRANIEAQPYGAPDISSLPGEAMALIRAFEVVEAHKIYNTRAPEIIRPEIRAILKAPDGERGKNTPAELYKWARKVYNGREQISLGADKALRILSTVIEEKPRDDKAARLVGYVLMEWRLFREAAELFARIRQRRPFEPQNYLIEGLALALQGKALEAALLYEIVLHGEYPRFGSYVKPVAALFYSDLLKTVIEKYGQDSLGRLCRGRLKQLQTFAYKKGRLALFWNLDDTDVDLHVMEDSGTEVNYSNTQSGSGGLLHWDNTTGLGPEMYEHPTLSEQGFDVFVNYFGTGSVEGTAPSATLVCAFNYSRETPLVWARCFSTVLLGEEEKVSIMPPWRPYMQ